MKKNVKNAFLFKKIIRKNVFTLYGYECYRPTQNLKTILQCVCVCVTRNQSTNRREIARSKEA